jgi:hypothetical protein
VLVDGVVVGTFTPAGPDYAVYTTTAFNVTAGSHTITFEGLDSTGVNTSLVDDIRVAAAGLAPGDAGFELPAVATYQYAPTGTPWSYSSGNAGVAANGSGFTSANPPAPEGVQVAFLQDGGSFNQSVAGWAAGSYTISF